MSSWEKKVISLVHASATFSMSTTTLQIKTSIVAHMSSAGQPAMESPTVLLLRHLLLRRRITGQARMRTFQLNATSRQRRSGRGSTTGARQPARAGREKDTSRERRRAGQSKHDLRNGS